MARDCSELRLMPALFTFQVAPELSLRNAGPPPYVDCTRPAFVEKFREKVCPVTYALPALSIATAFPASSFEPRMNCEYSAADPVALSFVMKTSVPVLAEAG